MATTLVEGLTVLAEIIDGKPIPIVPKVAASSLVLLFYCIKMVLPISMVFAPSATRMSSYLINSLMILYADW